MKKFGLMAIGIAFISIQFGCDAKAICDCAYDYNIELQIRKGASEQCILDPGFSLQADSMSVQVQNFQIDSSDCSVRLSSGKGKKILVLNKEGYPEARINIGNINYHDSDCCGYLDKRKYRIYWYELGEGEDPFVVQLE